MSTFAEGRIDMNTISRSGPGCIAVPGKGLGRALKGSENSQENGLQDYSYRRLLGESLDFKFVDLLRQLLRLVNDPWLVSLEWQWA